jgi:hypothetical protein
MLLIHIDVQKEHQYDDAAENADARHPTNTKRAGLLLVEIHGSPCGYYLD